MATNDELQMLDSVVDWLKVEHDYQFAEGRHNQSIRPTNHRFYLLDHELPHRWATFQTYHHQFQCDTDEVLNEGKKPRIDSKMVHNFGQSVLKCAATAREIFIWDAIARGEDKDAAYDRSWSNLSRYKSLLSEGSFTIPPQESIQPPDPGIRNVINAITQSTADENAKEHKSIYLTHSNAVMITCAGLAVRALLELKNSDQVKFDLPEPGVATGHLQSWNYKPQKTASSTE